MSTVFSGYGNTQRIKSQSNGKSVLKSIHQRQHSEATSSPSYQERDLSPSIRSKGALKAFPLPALENDKKLKKKCFVVIERNDELEEHEREKVAYINQLLHIQREKRRRSLERKQRQDKDRQRLYREKEIEAKKIKEQIQELRRQQDEKTRYRAQKQMLLARENEFHGRLLKEKLRRYELLNRASYLKSKEIELVRLHRERSNTPIAAKKTNSAISDTVLPSKTTKTEFRRRSVTVDELCLTSTTKDLDDDSIMKQGVNFSDSEGASDNILKVPSAQENVLQPSSTEKSTTTENIINQVDNLNDTEEDLRPSTVETIIGPASIVAKPTTNAKLSPRIINSSDEVINQDDINSNAEVIANTILSESSSQANLILNTSEKSATNEDSCSTAKEVNVNNVKVQNIGPIISAEVLTESSALPSTLEKPTENATLSSDAVKQETTSSLMKPPKILEGNIEQSPKSATKPLKIRLKRLFGNKTNEKATEQIQDQSVPKDTIMVDTQVSEQMLKTKKMKNKLKAQLEKIEKMQRENSESDNFENSSKEEKVNEKKKLKSELEESSKNTGRKNELNPISPEEDKNTIIDPKEIDSAEKESQVETAPEAVVVAASEAASSSLALLANTAATAPIAVMNVDKNTEELPTESQNVDENSPPTVEATISLTQNNAVAEDDDLQSTQKLPELYRISDMDDVEANTECSRKEANLTLINFEATPTVPPYLFNGESRGVSTPTPPLLTIPSVVVVASTVPVTLESAIPTPSSGTSEQAEVSITTTATSNANNLALSTSDHEVSSTQETLCESLKRSTSHFTQAPTTALISAKVTNTITVSASDPTEDAALVQNNQIDTTHHLPESNTTVRRRTRKFSTLDENVRNANVEYNKLRQHSTSHKRRKTICAESAHGLQSSPVEINFSGNATSPSTTTNPLEKPPTRRRAGRPSKSLTTVTNATKKLRRSISTSTPPNPTEDAFGRALQCNSPGVLTLVDTKIKHTYSKNNFVQNVFVPPEIEKCLEQESHDVNQKSTSVTKAKAKAKAKDKELQQQKSSNRQVASTSTEKRNSTLKTFKGAKMKLIDKPSAAVKPPKIIELKTKKIESVSKLSTPALGRRKKR